MSLAVSAVAFDHGRGRDDAYTVPLRFDEITPVFVPEWTRADPGRAAVAYRLDRLPATVHVLARFTASAGEAPQVEIRARSDNAVFPDVSPFLVQFGPAGDSGWCPIPLSSAALANGVLATTAQWSWQFRRGPADAWMDFDLTTHRVFVVVGAPTAPWSSWPADPANAALPWIAALEVACAWAAGARSASDAAALITRALNALGGSAFIYDAAVGAPHYTVLGAPRFLLAALIDRVRGGPGVGALVNCSDCATIVSTLANLVGADLWQSKMGLVDGGFRLNPILAIGGTEWSRVWGGFAFHEVAWSDDCDESDTICDACLHTDADTDPTQPPHTALLAANQVFGVPGSGDYRDQISAPPDRAKCMPQPALRVRRSVTAQAIAFAPGAGASLPFALARTARSSVRAALDAPGQFFFEGFRFFGHELEGWELVGATQTVSVPRPATLLAALPVDAQLADGARVLVSIWKHGEGAQRRLRIESIEVPAFEAVATTLSRVLADISCPLLIDVEGTHLGDVEYRHPDGVLVLFSRGNHIHVVRSTGAELVDVSAEAAAVDHWIVNAGLPVASATELQAALQEARASGFTPWRRVRIHGAARGFQPSSRRPADPSGTDFVVTPRQPAPSR